MKIWLIIISSSLGLLCNSKTDSSSTQNSIKESDITFALRYALEFSISSNFINDPKPIINSSTQIQKLNLVKYISEKEKHGQLFLEHKNTLVIDSIVSVSVDAFPVSIFSDVGINAVKDFDFESVDKELNSIPVFFVTNIYASNGKFFLGLGKIDVLEENKHIIYSKEKIFEFKKCTSGLIQFIKVITARGYRLDKPTEFQFIETDINDINCN